MFRHGAKAYINKEEEKAVMRQRLLGVAAGETVMADEVSEMFVSGNDSKTFAQLISDNQEIFRDLASGMNVKEIAIKMNQSESAIEKKLKTIRESLNVRTNIELIYKVLIRQIPHLNY